MGHEPKLSIEQRELLDLHLKLVIEENKISNLTRITNWDQGQLLHIEDSLLGLPEVLDTPEGRYADLGTGGGYPGIPIAIASGRETLLVDSIAKKTAALDRIVERLGIASTVRTYTGRAEELALEQPASFTLLSARALSSLPSLIELASPLLRLGGRLLCYKAAPDEAELEQCIALQNKLGMKVVSIRRGVLSDLTTERSIIVFEKIGEPTVKLPRRSGMAQKRPYKA